MHRRSKNINAPLEVKENESSYTKEKEEASFPDLSKDQKICKVIKSRVAKASKKENLSDGNQAQLEKCTLKYTKGLEKKSYHKEDVVSCQFTECFFDTLKGDMVGEHTLPLNRKSPTSLKYRRRSAIGVRGSPENNTLIQYLAQQRSNRQKAAFTQVSPFKRENVRSLKDKIDVFQQSFQSVQEAEGETGFSGLSQVDDASQEAGCSPNKVPYTKERNLDQWSEKFMSDNSGADLKENLRQNLTNSSKSDTRICTILSLCQDVAVTEPAAAVSKKWVYEQHNPIESLEAVLIRDTLETGHDFSSDHITKDVRSNVISDLSRKKVSFGEELSLEIFDESKPPITPLQMGNTSLNEHTQSGSNLRSVLKKTPAKQLMNSMKEYVDDAVDGGGGESLAISNCAKIFEALQTEKTETHSSEKPKRKRVTFGEVLSPEIFDETLPANTPLRKGATPVRHPGLQSNSPFAGSSLIEEPLSQPNFDCNDECLEPLQELVEGPVAAEDLLPVENAEVAETDKSDVIKTRSSTKRKCSTVSEGTDFSISRATNTKNVKDTKNPRKNKFQKQKNITTSAAKKTPKIKHTGYGKRRKKKVKKSLYGEREMASKKPLLSPIPEMPEFFSSASSPNSPKANVFFSEDIFLDDNKSGNAHKDVQQKPAVERMRNVCAVHMYSSSKDLDIAEASSSNNTVFQVSDGDLKSVSGIDHKFSNIVPDAKCVFVTSDYFQQGKETACVKEAKESGSLIENEKLQGNLLNKAERLSGLEFLEQEDTSVPEGAQRTQCPPKDSIRGSPPRRRRSSSAIYFPPVEKLEITGNDFPVSSFNVEEVLSAPQLKNDSLEPFRRKSDDNGERRVRRSMRLHKDAEIEGLAWIQVPNEIPKNLPLLASACKTRRTISTSILTESENIHHREQSLIQFSAPGKENNDSVNPADGPCKRWKRKSMCVSMPQETTTWSQTRKRSITNSVYRKVRRNPKHYEEVEIPLENNI
ncbi:cell division cycle-associated protein 2 isoform X7 [Harpia harpyja]|uniref:cell division cycle-associated protein 2 isoform X7 n=1 Tax=Harpia harpyja TaxID=202280 RepID=UPI0022B1F1F1|nr:cell division cycle-associated protein 2 isoform X7 [Harpia harpyja]